MELTKEQEQIAYQAFCGAPGWMNGVKAACEAVLALPGDELRKAAQKMADFHSISGTITRAHMTSLKAALAVPVPTDTVRLAPWYEQREEQHKSHLVRGKKTLCGLDEWGGGNVDFKFGVEQGITSCVRCLRVLALEGLKAKTQPDAAVEAIKRVRFPNIYKYPCPEGWSVNDEDARKIVAAVRAADAEKAGAKP